MARFLGRPVKVVGVFPRFAVEHEFLEYVANLVVTLPYAQHHPHIQRLMFRITVEPDARGVVLAVLVGVEHVKLDHSEPRVAVLFLVVLGTQLDASRFARLDVYFVTVPCLVLQREADVVPAFLELKLIEQVVAVRDLVFAEQVIADVERTPLPVEVVDTPDL